jgi:hypothetical protein
MKEFLLVSVSIGTFIVCIAFFHLCYSTNKVITEWADYWKSKEVEHLTEIPTK